MTANIEYLRGVKLLKGWHPYGNRRDPNCNVCALEALCFSITGVAEPRIPEGYPKWWFAFPMLNDASDNSGRIRGLLASRLYRYAIPADAERDERIMWRLLTLGVTKFASDALDRDGFADHAETMRAIGRVTRENVSVVAETAIRIRLLLGKTDPPFAGRVLSGICSAVHAAQNPPLDYSSSLAGIAAHSFDWAVSFLDEIDAEIA